MDTPIDIAREKFYSEYSGTCYTCKWYRRYKRVIGNKVFWHEYCGNEESENGGLDLEDIGECEDYEEK